MALRQAHMLLNSGSQAVSFVSPPAAPDLIVRHASTLASDRDGEFDGDVAQSTRRTRIWEFGTNLHCSIIGTCLSTAELRGVLGKVEVKGAATASDHDAHCLGVMLASRRQHGGRFLQKALDRCHRTAISRYAKARDADGLLQLWEESLRQGDIPGAYWAVLTHPATTEDVVKRAFADVHMLSHLVGAANRADIRRLRQLEADNAVLATKLARQQRLLHQGFVARDRTIRELNELFARQPNQQSERPAVPEPHADDEGLEAIVHNLNRRLAQEAARRERSERRAGELSAALKERTEELQKSRTECQSCRQELDDVERQLAALLKAAGDGAAEPIALSGLTLLYVGGRAHQIPQLKAMTERAGGRFLHHDGGIEHSSGLMPGLISRADRVFFPIDCISHDAVVAVKRHCRLIGKAYEPLRTASLACLLSALVRMTGCRETNAAERH
jgi:hypothetical protein